MFVITEEIHLCTIFGGLGIETQRRLPREIVTTAIPRC